MHRSTARRTPETPESIARWNRVHQLEISAAKAFDAGDYAIAEADAREAMKTGPSAGVGQEVLASALEAQGKDTEALEAYKLIADKGGVYPRTLLPYCLLLLKAGQWEEAVTYYHKALPYLALGSLVQANSHFSPDVVDPQRFETVLHIARGLTYGSSGSWGGHSQVDKEMAEYQEALRLSPDSDLANYYYGYGLQKTGHYDEAQQVYAKTIKIAQGTVKTVAEQAIAPPVIHSH